MSNFGIKIDLLKLRGAAVTDLQSQNGVQKCIVIPVNENNIYVGQKGCYLDLVAFEMKNPKYEATHTLKQSLSKAQRDAMTQEHRDAMPILGDLKPLGGNAATAPQPQYGYAPAPQYQAQGYAPRPQDNDPF